MRETIRKILSEGDLDWTNDIETSLPDNTILKNRFMVEMSLGDYLISLYSYDFVNVILTDGRVIEFTIDSYDIKYHTYNSLTHLVEDGGLSWMNGHGNYLTRDDFNSFDEMVKSYLDEFSMRKVPKTLEEVIKKEIPLGIHSIYTASL